ncbi:MAG: hypothetical protein ACK4FV_04115 [Candidatus Nitrosocaldus sp.]
METEELKKLILYLIEYDSGFRYAIAGAIGYKDMLDRFTALQEEMNKRFLELGNRIAENQARNDERFLRLEERIAKVEEEIRDLREETNRLREDTNKLIEETNRLREDMLEGFRRHDEEFKRHWESIENLRRDMQEGFRRHDEEFKRHWESIEKLRQDMLEGFRRHDEEFAKIRKDIREIRAYMEKTSITLEEEAREIIEYRLRERGLPIGITRLELADIEIDIYGIDSDYCIIGEVKTRASPNVIERVDKDIEILCKKHPEYLRKKVIKAIYAMQITSDAVKEGERRNIWIVTAKGELTELKIIQS